jgi:hypothetical protein
MSLVLVSTKRFDKQTPPRVLANVFISSRRRWRLWSVRFTAERVATVRWHDNSYPTGGWDITARNLPFARSPVLGAAGGRQFYEKAVLNFGVCEPGQHPPSPKKCISPQPPAVPRIPLHRHNCQAQVGPKTGAKVPRHMHRTLISDDQRGPSGPPSSQTPELPNSQTWKLIRVHPVSSVVKTSAVLPSCSRKIAVCLHHPCGTLLFGDRAKLLLLRGRNDSQTLVLRKLRHTGHSGTRYRTWGCLSSSFRDDPRLDVEKMAHR